MDWLVKPTPMPSRTRLTMSMTTSLEAPLSAAPMKNVTPPPNMDHLRPATRVTVAAKKEATSAAR
jgi:hypothetical protein